MLKCTVIVDKDGVVRAVPSDETAAFSLKWFDENRADSAPHRLVEMVEEAAWEEAKNIAREQGFQRDAALGQVAALREALGHLLFEWKAWQPGLTGVARTRAERALADTASAARAHEREVFRKGMRWWSERDPYETVSEIPDAVIDAALEGKGE